MAAQEVNNYINKRYDRWHDYSLYHCAQAGIPDSSGDVLDEVLLSLLQKEDKMLMRMLNSQKRMLSSCDFYTELDYYVLRTIKLNIYSHTAPFRHKYKTVATDANVNVYRLKLPEQITDDTVEDRPAITLSRFNQVRAIFESIDIPDKAKRIFAHRFFNDLPFSCWDGQESKKELYDTYYKVIKAIKAQL